MSENKRNVEILEDHLHQQYAENDNNRFGMFSSFIIGVIALFGIYGQVFVNTNNYEKSKYGIEIYLLILFITAGMLFFLALLALNFGYSVRRDHFIVNNIRKNRFTKSELILIFGDEYSPHGKKRHNFIPNIYNLFFWLFFSSSILLFITAVIKVYQLMTIISCCIEILFIFLVLSSNIIFTILMFRKKESYYKKYKELAKKHRE